jgi:5-oxoprolinase (ATP-hydrolysing) subunit A
MNIDLNADLAEGFGPWRMGDDEALLEVLSSANLACGFHAGDPAIMRRTVEFAMARGVDIGAHVGFPDRQGFGRRIMQIDPAELAAMVIYQLGALYGICRALGGSMTHMSFHGALGNMVAADHGLAAALVGAVAAFDPKLAILTSASAAIETAAGECGLKIAKTFLADRAYGDDGLLVSRKLAGSVIHERELVLERVRRILLAGEVITHSGRTLPMRPASILLHGDTDGAVGLAKAIRREIETCGGRIVPLSRQLMQRADNEGVGA